MSIEKPISTIRKAIQGVAEEMALNENMEVPTKDHYKEAINTLRITKLFEPENYERDIKIGAKAKELKDEMGKEKYRVFNNVLKDLALKYDNIVEEERDEILEENLSKNEIQKRILFLNQKYLKQKEMDLKSDPRIRDAFSESMYLVDKTMKFMTDSIMKRVKDYMEQPAIRIPNPEIITILYTKFLKLFRDV